MERSEKRRLAEALILASAEPISAARIADIIPYCKPGQAKDLVNELNTEYQEQDRAFEIWEVAGGFQIRTRAEFSGYLQKLQKQRPMRLSRAALETLAILAYKQPATRAEVENVRGVDVGAVIKSLLDRDLVKMVGHREVPGRPMLYGTTKRFLEVFGLESLKNLPTLRDLEELTREHDAAQAVVAETEAMDTESEAAALEEPGVVEASDGVASEDPVVVEPGDEAASEEPVAAHAAAEEDNDDWEEPEIVEPRRDAGDVADEAVSADAATGESDESGDPEPDEPDEGIDPV